MTTMNATTMATNGWSLEVVRGRDVGRRFALSGPELVLGNAPGSELAIDLAEQETGSLRRMAARQALLESRGGDLTIRDLDSPAGTFVNRQRVLPGTSRPMAEGDVIQLGGVQLRVVADRGAGPAAPRTTSTGSPFAFTLRSGATCRNWDDFLVVAAHRWGELREELTSGRLATFLAATGRDDLTPQSSPGTPDDERLDVWLGQIPATRPARPELDVHPSRLTIRAAGGGTTRRSLRVANVGHRLLRSTARVEPVGTAWLWLATEFAGKPFVTVESTDLAIEVESPETLTKPLSAEVVIESNGGSRRVEVVLERPKSRTEIEAEPVRESPREWGIGAWLALRGPAARVVWFVGVMLAIRLLVAVCEGMIPLPVEEASRTTLGLIRPAAGFAVLWGVAGFLFAWRRGEPADRIAAVFAAAFLGLIAATAAVALGRTIEVWLPDGTILGLVSALGAWAAIGAGLAGLTILVVPTRAGGGRSR